MDDAQLVEAARAGDRDALAAIYQRYADPIYDFCASVLRNQAEAADALQETFAVAFKALADLAEPARLRPWLYALAHRSVLDRIEHYGPAFFTDDGELSYPGGPSERLSRPELAEFVWQAAAGLDIADRVLLDLHLRQALDGRDLAGASGLPGPQLDSRLARLRDQVDRSLGALVVARTGRRSCPDLFAILERSQGRLTAEYRNQITAHVDECERCNPRRRIAPAAVSLLAAAPMATAPGYLQRVVLGAAELSDVEQEGAAGRESLLARAGWAFQRDGFPVLAAAGTGALAGSVASARPVGPVLPTSRATRVVADIDTDPRGTRTTVVAAAPGPGSPWAPAPSGQPGPSGPLGSPAPGEPGPDRHDRLGMLIGALAGLIILVVAAVVVLPSRGKAPSKVAAVGASTTTAAATTPSTTTATTVSQSTTTVPATTVVANGHMILGTKAIDLGVTTTTTTLQFGNDGAAPLNFTALASGSGLTVNPITGTLAPGASQTLTVTLDRMASPPGPFNGSIRLGTQAGNTTIAITAVVDPGPAITNEAENPQFVSPTTGCTKPTTTTRVMTATITANVSASQPLTVVVLHSRFSTSSTEATPIPMTMSGTVYTATLGPYPMIGTVDWWITALDSAKATGVSSHGSLVVKC